MAPFATPLTSVRPTFIGVLLLAMAVVPWRDHEHPRGRPARALPLTIEMTPPPAIDVIKPPVGFADAREWPRGMVIVPAVIDGAIVQWQRSPLDGILSVFLAPFRWIGT